MERWNTGGEGKIGLTMQLQDQWDEYVSISVSLDYQQQNFKNVSTKETYSEYIMPILTSFLF